MSVALGVALCFLSAAADATPRKPSRAARRFEKKGKKAYAKKRFGDAVAAFKLAYEADPYPRFLFNTARAYDKKGDLESALEFLVRYVEEETDAEERADGQAELKILQQRLKESHAPLDLAATPEGAQVAIAGGGEELTMTAPVSRWLKAGTWKLRVTATGHVPWQRELVVESGKPVQLEVVLKEEGAVEPKPEATARAPAAEKKRKKRRKPKAEAPKSTDGGSPLPWLVVGGGGALLAGGAAFLVLAGNARDDRDALKGTGAFYQDIAAKQDEAEGHALLANVLLGAGVVASGTGVVLLLLGGEADDASASGLSVRPGLGGLVVEGTL